MWEIAVLIAAIAFAVLVLFTVPALLQIRDAAKQLEFTLRETGESLARLRAISEKAEAVIEQGGAVVGQAGRALMAVDQVLGRRGSGALAKVLAGALQVAPIAMAAYRAFTRNRR